MKIVQESAEHHFLTLLEKLKQDAAGWTGLSVDDDDDAGVAGALAGTVAFSASGLAAGLTPPMSPIAHSRA